MPDTPHPSLTWTDAETPVAVAFDDPYFAHGDGAAESAHVFLAGNDLPARARPGFRVAEIGFGTGLNLVVAAAALSDGDSGDKAAGALGFTSFEAFPMHADDMARALARWPHLAQWADALVAEIAAGRTRFALGRFDVTLILGDARQTLPAWQGSADAWFLDGFSPARNPELWGPELMQAVAAHTAPGGSFATYTAAGHVRRALQDAGFAVTRRPGFGRKRHMSVGRLPDG